MEHKRPTWDEYFMELAEVVAKRSTCLRRNIGAVVVKDKRVLATGYNGAPTGLSHCSEVGCLRERLGIPSGERVEMCRGLHAEQNALVQAARYGIPLEGSVIYCTNQPCVACAKMLINAGVTKIIYKYPYPDRLAQDLLAESNVTVVRFQEPK
jgi:dCMP deaminase